MIRNAPGLDAPRSCGHGLEDCPGRWLAEDGRREADWPCTAVTFDVQAKSGDLLRTFLNTMRGCLEKVECPVLETWAYGISPQSWSF